ncbi:MAG TPA: hypothetical protein VFC58_12420 [Desulfosporosinus sp.]|nr:hypothetical protein [Desulfosporosinus sp.]
MKRIFAVLTLFMLLCILIPCGSIWADESKVAASENGGQVITERNISPDQLEVFTKKDNKIYRKVYNTENGNRSLTSIEEVKLRKMGTKIKSFNSDSQLKNSLVDKLKSGGLNLTQLPSKIDFSQSSYLPPVGAQKENSCVAWSVGYYLRTFQQAKDLRWIVGNNPSHIFSSSYL